ncbi:MOB kinase activator 1A isoform X3 [Mustela erminea]|uniref:MOB kinase activator 1A isoform X3 n=1 Tax=Mustela erminea TaxID=36723 RepID=UPI001386834B|nr:MOB kinase activator 1A isoform X3 [Mustela erminea]
MSFLFSSRSSKTFKPKKNIPEGSHQYELLKHAEATLGSGNLRQAVMLPEGEDLNEWIAVNTVDFFNQINMLYGTITEFCTEASCPVMSAGPRYEYHWADGTNIKKPIKCSAPKYIDYLMTWVQDQLDDETLFPSKIVINVNQFCTVPFIECTCLFFLGYCMCTPDCHVIWSLSVSLSVPVGIPHCFNYHGHISLSIL